MYLTDVVSEEERSGVLGNFNSASSIGFILGPVVGGYIAELPNGFHCVAILSGSVFVLNAGLVWCLLPPCRPQHDNQETFPQDESSGALQRLASDELIFSPRNLLRSFHSVDWPDLWDLFLIKFLAGFSVLVFRANFTIVLKQKFSASPKIIGYTISYSGIMATISGLVVGWFSRMYSSPAHVLLRTLLLQCVTLVCLTLAPSMWVVFLGLTPLSFVTSTQRVAATDLTIRRVGQQGRGALLGLSQSIMSLARMLSPFLAGLAQEVHTDGASALGVITTVFAILLMYKRPQDPEERRKKEE